MSPLSKLKRRPASPPAGPDRSRPAEPSLDLPLDEKPFRLAKSFSLIAIVMIFAAVLTLAAVVSRQAEVIITKRVEDDTLKLLENLTHQMYENFLRRVSDSEGKTRLRELYQQVLLHQVITNTIYGFDLKRVLIYEPKEGRVIYDTEQSLVSSNQAQADDYRAYREALRLHVPSRPENIRTSTWWAGGRIPYNPYESLAPPQVPSLNIFPPDQLPGLFRGFQYRSEEPNEDASDYGRQPDDQASYLSQSSPQLGSPNSPRSRSTVGNDYDVYIDGLRSQTVFRYEGGSYLFLNFFPRGNFVLRSYKAMENPEYKFTLPAHLCYSEAYQSDPRQAESCNAWGITGVVELDRDLTPEYRQIARLQYFALSMAFFLALILTIVLRWVVSRGEAILTKRNQERQALREQLDQAERLAGLGSMVATVAHEIRNPLGIIHSTADVLNRFLAQNPDQARLARAIVEEANRLSQVVTEFLDFARPPTPRLEPMVVEELLEEILAFLEVTLTRAGIELRTDFRENQTPVPGDVSMLHRAFLNILVNAIQAMDDGGLICVGTRLEQDGQKGSRLLISISDTGPGLSDEAAKKLFSPFYTTKAKGTGLGLVIVRNIIEGHGGEIELKNGPPPQFGDDSGPGLVVNIHLKF